MENKENNLISIDDVIFQAKRQGVDFGRGNPRERLRYLTKIGLLPQTKRKSFNGKTSTGAYPEYVIELLKEIDKEIKAGKSIQGLKNEKEKKGLIEVPCTYITFPSSLEVSQPLYRAKGSEIEDEVKPQRSKIKIPQSEKEVFSRPFGKIAPILKIVFLGLILGGIILFLSNQTITQMVKENFYSYLLTPSFNWVQKLVQAPSTLVEAVEEKLKTRETFLLARPEPYLTINAETDINAPLNVKEQITARAMTLLTLSAKEQITARAMTLFTLSAKEQIIAPALTLAKGDFKATLISADLTTERTYTFPDLSGVVCLTTGNCIGLGGEVFSPGGILNRLAKFISEKEIGASSIEDLYEGVALTIDSEGKIGIGHRNPNYPLHVTGRIQATGDICTNLAGGRCLSTLPFGGAPPAVAPGIGGSGTASYLPIWTTGTTLGNSIIYQSGSNIGIGTIIPTYTLDVYGTSSVRGFIMPTGAASGYILTSDASGIGTWQPPPAGILPSGLAGQTLRSDGTNWIANYFLYNSGTAIGIGTTSTLATLTISGNAIFATTTLPQFVLKYDDSNYLNFSINDSQSLIEASKKLVFNSLTGEIKLGSNVNLFDAFGAKIQATTFISTTTDSTVRKSGELVFRASLPIFRFSVPAQTTSTAYVIVSKTFSSTDSLNSITPAQLPGTSRVYAFLINIADNIAPISSSTWRVYRPNTATTTFTFNFAGQNLSSLETGNPHLTATTILPDNDWQLEVSVPLASKSIRIFNIFLLTFDKIQ